MSQFYVELVASPCPETGCKRVATHEVMRVGKIRYGKWCKAHALRQMNRLERTHATTTRRN